MGQLLVMREPGTVAVEEYPDPPLQPGEVRVATLYSGISAGTQLTLYRGKNPFVAKIFDDDKRLCLDRPPGGSLYPARGCWGYEEVGRVVELGSAVTKVKNGDLIFGCWGHNSRAVLAEDTAAEQAMPEGLEPINGIFSSIGSVAMNAILDAGIHVGETVAVFGMGVPGQIAAQLARLNGARALAVDLDDGRLDMAGRLGAAHLLNPGRCDVGLEIKKITGKGADKSIEISGFGAALHEAIRSTLYNGTVVCAGFITGALDGLRLGEEFHHNRITLVSSQIQDVNPRVSHAWNRLRMQKTVLSLARSGQLDLVRLITDRFPFAKGAEAYRLLDTSRQCLQVVLEF